MHTCVGVSGYSAKLKSKVYLFEGLEGKGVMDGLSGHGMIRCILGSMLWGFDFSAALLGLVYCSL